LDAVSVYLDGNVEFVEWREYLESGESVELGNVGNF